MQPQYLWWLIGLGLLLTELVLPGLTLFFFGVGAIVTGFVCWGFDGVSLNLQIWIFLLVSIVSLIGLRRWLCRIFRGNRKNGLDSGLPDDYVGRRVFVTRDISPDRPGRVEVNGAEWTAESDESIPVGERVAITSRDALTLSVKRLPSGSAVS